jgi:predicted enzyme related to lactoylglutathione lyase
MGNKIVHIELGGDDAGAQSEFYSKLFDWHVEPMGDTYALWKSGTTQEDLGGGFRKLEEGEAGSQRTVVYIQVDDIEAKLAEIEGAGGRTIVPKTEIGGGHGFFAWFADPHGTVVALWNQT